MCVCVYVRACVYNCVYALYSVDVSSAVNGSRSYVFHIFLSLHACIAIFKTALTPNGSLPLIEHCTFSIFQLNL